MSASSKIKIKLGQMEVEYEGTDAFIKEELQGFLVQMSALQPQVSSDGHFPLANASPKTRIGPVPPAPIPFDENAVFNL